MPSYFRHKQVENGPSYLPDSYEINTWSAEYFILKSWKFDWDRLNISRYMAAESESRGVHLFKQARLYSEIR